MDEKVIQVKRRDMIFESVGRTKTYRPADKKTAPYVVKSRFTTAQARLNIKSSDKLMASEGGLKKPVIGKALQYGVKYMRKGNQCLTKKEIGARF